MTNVGRSARGAGVGAATLRSMNDLRVGIYEDDPDDVRQLRAAVGVAAHERAMGATVSVFRHARDLSDAAERGDLDLVFLDVDMGEGEPDGVEMGRRLHEWNRRLPFAFVTYSSEWALDSYQVQALHYLVKPVTAARVGEVLDRMPDAVHGRRVETREISVMSDYRCKRIPVSGILYAEVRRNTVIIHMDGRAVRANMTLTVLARQAGDDCLRCHRSFLVNLNRVRHVDGNDFVLDDGTRVPIRINGRHEVVTRYQDWLAARLG